MLERDDIFPNLYKRKFLLPSFLLEVNCKGGDCEAIRMLIEEYERRGYKTNYYHMQEWISRSLPRYKWMPVIIIIHVETLGVQKQTSMGRQDTHCVRRRTGTPRCITIVECVTLLHTVLSNTMSLRYVQQQSAYYNKVPKSKRDHVKILNW